MQTRPTISRFVAENVGWMIGSLILAVIVWYTANSAENPVIQRRFQGSVPVKIVLPADGNMMVASQDTTSVQVTVRAPQSVWNNLEVDNIRVVADVSNLPVGSYQVDLSGSLTDPLRGVVTDISPPQINVVLARRVDKKVNVTVQVTQEPPVGFTVGTTTPQVSTVDVSGAEDKVAQVVSAQARISLQDQRNKFSRLVTLVAVDANNNVIQDVVIDPVEINVDVDIAARPDVSVLSVIPKFAGEVTSGYLRRNYSMTPDTVVVRGDRTTIDNMNGYVSTEPIDLTGKTATFTQHVKLSLPEGVSTVEPVDTVVTVEIVPVEGSREFPNIPVQVRGLDPVDFSITVQPDHVTVILSGPQPILDKLTANDITVTASVSGLSVGTYQVTLEGTVTEAEVDLSLPNSKVDVSIEARNPTATPSVTPAPATTAVATGSATLIATETAIEFEQ